MKRYSDLEVDLLIDEISAAALEAIEREAAALQAELAMKREMERWRMEAETYMQEIANTKRLGIKNTVLTALIGVLGGMAIGVCGSLLLGGR